VSRSFTNTNADQLVSASPFATAAPITLACWVKPSAWSNPYFFSLMVAGSKFNRFTLGTDYLGTHAIAAILYDGTTAAETLSSGDLATGSWQLVLCTFASAAQAAYYDGGDVGTGAATQTPAGINQARVSGYATNGGFYADGPMAHLIGFKRALDALEVAYLAGGGNPQYLKNLSYYCRLTQGNSPETADVGTMSLTVTGTTVSSDNPNVAPFFTTAAIGNQSYTQGTAISPIAIASKFQGVGSAFTCTLEQLAAAVSETTTSGTGTAQREVTLTSASAFSAGDYIQLGSGGTPTLVLAISGAVVLMATDQTWTSGETVYRCAVDSGSIAGCTVASGSWAGTPTGSLATSPNFFFRATNNSNAAASADSNLFSITVNALAAAPVFSVNPTVASVSAGGYTVDFTPDASCVAYLGAYANGATAPTGAQLRAGTGAIALVSSPVSAAASSLSLTGLDFPVHDLYVGLHNSLGSSAVFALTDELKAPPAGKVYREFTATISSNTNYHGVCSVGDIEETDTVLTDSGETIDYFGDGGEQFFSVGRQSRVGRTYDVAGQTWYLDSAGSEYYTIWYDDTPPTFNGINVQYSFPESVAIAPVDVSALFSSIYGDPISVTATGLPTGLSISGGTTLVGTATESGFFTPSLVGTDLAGMTVPGYFDLFIGDPSVPGVVGMTRLVGEALLVADFYDYTEVAQVDNSIPTGTILAQSPAAGTEAPAFTVVTLTISVTSDALTLPVLPGITFNNTRAYNFATDVQKAITRKATRWSLRRWPRVNWTIIYELLRDDSTVELSELKLLMGFFNAMRGRANTFFYQDPAFNSVTAEPFGTGDGETKAFQLTATYRASPESPGTLEIIQTCNGTPTIYDNDTPTSAFILDVYGVVNFTAAPLAGHALTWSGSFSYQCELDDDSIDFAQMFQNWWELKVLKFTQVIK
jgi:uncharacterized protein (TIGR02217 family)